jgi:hypothetical protein
MLGYLDALITALSLRDATEAERLLAHPLARLLPADVCEEAQGFVSGARDPLAVPMRALQLRRQTAELLHEVPALADAPESIADGRHEPMDVRAPDSSRDGPRTMGSARRTRRARPQQMELPLSA